MFVILSGAKNLYDYLRDPSLSLRVTLLSDLSRVLHAIFKQDQSTVAFDSTRPVRMLIWMNVIFRVGHESEHVALWVANASDVENGAVRVDGVIAVRRRTVRVDVGKGDLVVGDE